MTQVQAARGEGQSAGGKGGRHIWGKSPARSEGPHQEVTTPVVPLPVVLTGCGTRSCWSRALTLRGRSLTIRGMLNTAEEKAGGNQSPNEWTLEWPALGFLLPEDTFPYSH